MVTLKNVLVTAPVELREELEPLPDRDLLERCRALRYQVMSGPDDASRYTLRALAQRHQQLDNEVDLDLRVLRTLTRRPAPELLESFGVADDCAAELLLVVGGNPERIRSDAALAKLCGACPPPASSGTTTRHRLNRTGHRQANAALHRILAVRMALPRTHHRLSQATHHGRQNQETLRCLKRSLRREVYRILVSPHKNSPSFHGCCLTDYRSINAVVESFWGRVGTELLNRRRWTTRTELANALFEYLRMSACSGPTVTRRGQLELNILKYLEIFHNRRR